jgi:site-specific recombinase XerD
LAKTVIKAFSSDVFAAVVRIRTISLAEISRIRRSDRTSYVLDKLVLWRKETAYRGEGDFLFPSEWLNGTKPLTPDMVLKKIIRPALDRANGKGKVIGWHSFRHSLATNLRSLGVDVKVAQDLLRHANSRITMDWYTQAISSDKRNSSGRQIDLLLGKEKGADCAQHP